MIKFKRGSTLKWLKHKTPLDEGQPGYDKERHKIKIGNGKNLWADLPNVSGLSSEEILCSEQVAKNKVKEEKSLLESLVGFLTNSSKNKLSENIITYGTEAPDENTVGQIYLQHYDAEPEVDYVVETGRQGNWIYQKWRSGIARCWATFIVDVDVTTEIEKSALYHNSTSINSKKYPFEFKEPPIENATLVSPGGVAWLAGCDKANTASETAKYTILSIDSLTSAAYKLNLQVLGSWRE